MYIDNDGVRDVFISCTTAGPVGSVMLTKVLEVEGALAISSWFTRVPSTSNIADSPSGGGLNDLIAVKAKHEQVEPLELLKALEPVGPASPIEKGAIACFSPSVLDVEHKYLVLCIRVYVEQTKV